MSSTVASSTTRSVAARQPSRPICRSVGRRARVPTNRLDEPRDDPELIGWTVRASKGVARRVEHLHQFVTEHAPRDVERVDWSIQNTLQRFDTAEATGDPHGLRRFGSSASDHLDTIDRMLHAARIETDWQTDLHGARATALALSRLPYVGTGLVERWRT